MNRRSFFGFLAGAPIAVKAAAVAPAVADTVPARLQGYEQIISRSLLTRSEMRLYRTLDLPFDFVTSAQRLESRAFPIDEICRVMSIPPATVL